MIHTKYVPVSQKTPLSLQKPLDLGLHANYRCVFLRMSVNSNVTVVSVMDEWIIVEHWWSDTGKPKYGKKNLSPCHYYYQKDKRAKIWNFETKQCFSRYRGELNRKVPSRWFLRIQRAKALGRSPTLLGWVSRTEDVQQYGTRLSWSSAYKWRSVCLP